MPKNIRDSAQFRHLMPHAFPCWCRECQNAYAKCMYRKRQGLPADWTPEPRACEWCGWSFVPHPARWRTKRFCNERCRAASQGQSTPTDSCRLYHYKCYDCGASLGLGGRRKDYIKCDACRSYPDEVDSNRRKNIKRRGAYVGEHYGLDEIAARDRYRCHLCGRKVDMAVSRMAPLGPTIDHLVPVSAGGKDRRANVRLAHRRCNVSRGAGGTVQLLLVG